jgi:hypothetical protein
MSLDSRWRCSVDADPKRASRAHPAARVSVESRIAGRSDLATASLIWDGIPRAVSLDSPPERLISKSVAMSYQGSHCW